MTWHRLFSARSAREAIAIGYRGHGLRRIATASIAVFALMRAPASLPALLPTKLGQFFPAYLNYADMLVS